MSPVGMILPPAESISTFPQPMFFVHLVEAVRRSTAAGMDTTRGSGGGHCDRLCNWRGDAPWCWCGSAPTHIAEVSRRTSLMNKVRFSAAVIFLEAPSRLARNVWFQALEARCGRQGMTGVNPDLGNHLRGAMAR